MTLIRPDQIDGFLSFGANKQIYYADDFDWGGTAAAGAASVPTGVVFGQGGWRSSLANSGTITYVTTGQDGVTQGVLQLENTGNAASLAAFIRGASGPINNRVLSTTKGQRWKFRYRVNVVALSTGTQRFTDFYGLINGAAAAPTDGLYVEYSDNINSGNWNGVGMRATVKTSATGGSSVPVVAGAYVWIEILWNGTAVAWGACPADSAMFLVNGVSIGTVAAANVPANAVSHGAMKLSSIGTGQKLSLIDFTDANLEWGTPRAA